MIFTCNPSATHVGQRRMEEKERNLRDEGTLYLDKNGTDNEMEKKLCFFLFIFIDGLI